MDNDEIICDCMSITMGQIRDAINKGASSVEDIQSMTGAGTVCGSCIDTIQDIVDSCGVEGE